MTQKFKNKKKINCTFYPDKIIEEEGKQANKIISFVKRKSYKKIIVKIHEIEVNH